MKRTIVGILALLAASFAFTAPSGATGSSGPTLFRFSIRHAAPYAGGGEPSIAIDPRGVEYISYPSRPADVYAADLLSSLDVAAVRDRSFRIVIDYGYSSASLVLPLVLGPLGVEAVSAHAFVAEREAPQPSSSRYRPCGRGV